MFSVFACVWEYSCLIYVHAARDAAASLSLSAVFTWFSLMRARTRTRISHDWYRERNGPTNKSHYVRTAARLPLPQTSVEFHTIHTQTSLQFSLELHAYARPALTRTNIMQTHNLGTSGLWLCAMHRPPICRPNFAGRADGSNHEPFCVHLRAAFAHRREVLHNTTNGRACSCSSRGLRLPSRARADAVGFYKLS